MNWKTIKLLGGIGSILAIAPYTNFVGWILVVIALYGISQQTGNKKVFSNYLISVILAYVSMLVLTFGVLGSTFLVAVTTSNGDVNFGLIIGILIVLFGTLILSAYFVKRSFDEVSKETGVDSFRTAGNLIFWGSVTMVVLVGFILYFIGYIMQVVAFFSLPDELLPREPDEEFKKQLSAPEN